MASSQKTVNLKLGTRGSTLARLQSQMIADAVEKRHPHVSVELVICKTTGDKIQDKPLAEAGGKGLFTKELEEALLEKRVDFAVHSFKDVPVTMPLVDQTDLVIAAVPEREDPRDVIATADAKMLQQLHPRAKVGTGSLRRRCQILALRPDLVVEQIRGNIDTRLRKLEEKSYDAVILAFAGLRRSGLFNSSSMQPIDVIDMLPAAAQGALALQCRRSDAATRELLGALDDAASRECVELERQVVLALNGDCHSPIAALATITDDTISLHTAIGARGGELPVIRAHASAPRADAMHALERVLASLEKLNVRSMLAGS